MTQKSAEWTVQVLVEMEDGSDIPRFTRDYVEGAIPKMFSSARDIRFIVTVTDEADNVIVKKFDNNPTEELRERAWA
jgi:hypothetical protein